MKNLFKVVVFGICISLILNVTIHVIYITLFKKINLYEYANFKYFDDYDYNKVIEKNTINVDLRLSESFKQIMGIFLYMENNKYSDTTFNSKYVNKIEDISFDYNSMLSDETLGTSITYIDKLGNTRCRILINFNLIDIEDRDMITFVLLHEIAHSAYNIEHYDNEYDLMNTQFNSVYYNSTDIKYIIQDFTINLNKYERYNN